MSLRYLLKNIEADTEVTLYLRGGHEIAGHMAEWDHGDDMLSLYHVINGVPVETVWYHVAVSDIVTVRVVTS